VAVASARPYANPHLDPDTYHPNTISNHTNFSTAHCNDHRTMESPKYDHEHKIKAVLTKFTVFCVIKNQLRLLSAISSERKPQYYTIRPVMTVGNQSLSCLNEPAMVQQMKEMRKWRDVWQQAAEAVWSDN